MQETGIDCFRTPGSSIFCPVLATSHRHAARGLSIETGGLLLLPHAQTEDNQHVFKGVATRGETGVTSQRAVFI